MRLLTYNILKGGQMREAEIIEVIQSVDPDVVVVQEVLEVDRFQQIATGLGMSPFLAHSQGRLPLWVGLLSRLPVLERVMNFRGRDGSMPPCRTESRTRPT